MYSYSPSSSRSHSPSPTRTPTSGSTLSLSELADLLRAADTDDRCAEAASALAQACGGFGEGTLRELLSGLPAEAPLPVLCGKLADALVAHEVTSAAIWLDLLHVIKSDPRVAGAQLALYQHYARSLADLQVTDEAVWDKVADMPFHSPDELVQAGTQIAASMELTGFDGSWHAPWGTLFCAMHKRSDGSRHVQIAQGFVEAHVNRDSTWQQLFAHLDKCGYTGPQLIPLVQMCAKRLHNERAERLLISVICSATAGCNAAQLHDIVMLATTVTALEGRDVADMWSKIGEAALQLDSRSLERLFYTIEHCGTTNSVPGMAWDRFFQRASVKGGISGIARLAVALRDRFGGNTYYLERALELALSEAGSRDVPALMAIVKVLRFDFSLESHRDLWLNLLTKACQLQKQDPGSGLRLLCDIRRQFKFMQGEQGEQDELMNQLTQQAYESKQQGNLLGALLEFESMVDASTPQGQKPTFERMVEIAGPTPHAAVIARVLHAMEAAEMEFSSPLMRRLLEAMSDETALQLLPFMLSGCELATDLNEEAPLSLLVLTLEKAMRCDSKAVLRALDPGRHRVLKEEEGAFRGPQEDADTLTALLVRLVFGKDLVIHPACRELGDRHLCNLILNIQSSRLARYARPDRAMIENAIVKGSLNLDQIGEIRDHRELVRKGFPDIRWDMVFNPGVDAPTTRMHVGPPESSSEYVVSLIAPNDVRNLILGHTVSSWDGSPQGIHPELMLRRLAGGWVVWSIENSAGDTVGAAWAILSIEEDLVIDSIDVQANMREAPLGNNLVDALLAFGPKVAAAIGARRVFGTAREHDSLTEERDREWLAEAIDSFKQPTDRQTHRSDVPSFMGLWSNMDHFSGKASYFIIEPQ